jgi:N6-adenosine-specific RNA methylase IME4
MQNQPPKRRACTNHCTPIGDGGRSDKQDTVCGGMQKRPPKRKQFGVIYAEPAWDYGDKTFLQKFSGAGRISAEVHYPTMPLEQIKNLQVNGRAVKDLAAPDATLFLWATGPKLEEALEVMRAWGFTYRTLAFVWHKQTKHGKERATLGRWTMGSTEFVLFGRMGKIKPVKRNVRQFLESPVTGHSAKPNEVRHRIEQLLPDAPKIELFHRGNCPQGWTCWGNESKTPKKGKP